MSTHSYSLRKRESPVNSPSPKRGYKKRKEQKQTDSNEEKAEKVTKTKRSLISDLPSFESDEPQKAKDEVPVNNLTSGK